MTASNIIKEVNTFLNAQETKLHDWADFVNTFLFLLLSLLAAGTIVGHGFAEPMTCFSYVSPSGVNFDDSYMANCWVEGTYNFPKDYKHPKSEVEWKDAWQNYGIGYYQWMPFINTLMAVLVFIAIQLWKKFATNLPDINMESICTSANSCKNMSIAERKTNVKDIARVLYNFIRNNQKYQTGLFCKIRNFLNKNCKLNLSKFNGSKIFFSYMKIKCVFIVVYIITLLKLHFFYNLNTQTIAKAFEYNNQEVFPVMTNCRWSNVLNSQQDYLGQCFLSYNVVNRYIFGSLWVYCIMGLVVNIMSFLMTNYEFFNKKKYSDITKLIRVEIEENYLQEEYLKKFTEAIIQDDCLLLLKLVEASGGSQVTGEVLFEMWCQYEVEFDIYKTTTNAPTTTTNETLATTENTTIQMPSDTNTEQTTE